MTTGDRVPLTGSDRGGSGGAPDGAAVDPATQVRVTVVVRRRAALPTDLVSGGRTLGREELAATHGADPADLDLVAQALEGAGAQVETRDVAGRRVIAVGPAGALSGLFGTMLRTAEAPNPTGGDAPVSYRQRTGALSLPADLADVVTAVLGLDDRPQASPRLQVVKAAQVNQSFTPPQVATLYDFPADTDGSGWTVAVLELGGGIAQSDLDAYFGQLGIPTPTVQTVGVDGATNDPGTDTGADTEVALDVEVIGGVAPGATQVVYFAPNTDAGFLDALTTAVHADPTPVAVSISWGQSEDEWTAQARDAFTAACEDAVALGVTVTAAAGDDGSNDRSSDGDPHADFPASSPSVLGCGGTNLLADGSTITSETVWNSPDGGATGGGVSDVYPLPDWQADVGVPVRAGTDTVGRGVPDVAGVADPATGWQVYVGRESIVVGGTSAVAPMWAGLLARLAQSLRKGLGLLQPSVYAGVAAGEAAPGFRDITEGDNGAYQAAPGWDACTGLGSPDGEVLLGRLQEGTSA